jgi:hypothetical protein
MLSFRYIEVASGRQKTEVYLKLLFTKYLPNIYPVVYLVYLDFDLGMLSLCHKVEDMKTRGTLNMNSEESVDGRAVPALLGIYLRAPPVDVEHRRVSLQRQGVG